MKKSESEVVRCCACLPYQKFYPPNAAEQARAHYEAGKHVIEQRVTGSAVQVDS